MNQSFGSWMLTGGIHGEIHREASRLQHLSAIRDVQSQRSAARAAARNAAIAEAIDGLRARFTGRDARTAPDCCPA